MPLAEAKALHALWPGSELRVIEGGHATGVLLQAEALRSALRDALGAVSGAVSVRPPRDHAARP